MRFQNPVVDAEIVIAKGNNEDSSWAGDPIMPLMRQVWLFAECGSIAPC